VSQVDLAVIGGGPAGYAAALRARHRGLTAVLVEDREVGGVCLNRGCIPSKVMLHLVEVAATSSSLHASGVFDAPPNLIYDRAVAHRDDVVGKLRGGVHTLLRSAGVEVVAGRGRLGEGGVVVGDRTVEARHVLLATGSSPVRPPIAGMHLPGVIDSDGALRLEALPRRVLVMGAGAVGCEWAAIFNGFGVEVVLVEMEDHLLTGEDAAVANVLERSLASRAVDVRTGVTVEGVERSDRGLAVTAAGDVEVVDLVLVAVGRRPNTDGLGLDEHGVALDSNGFVKTDATMRTSAANISAAGDAAGAPLLAHKAAHEAMAAVDRLAGVEVSVRHDLVPSVTYTSPEVASVGMTVDAARQKDTSSEAHVVSFAAIGRAVATGPTQGFAQLVTSGAHKRIVGGQIVGPHAGDLIAEIALAVELEATLGDLAATIHPHPTHAEVLHEVALAGLGVPLHISRPSARRGTT
jgi:dihydrolipoamide dehydrogenase